MENLDAWSIRIARIIAPDEVDLAPFITQAFVSGEDEQSSGGGLGGFGPVEMQMTFPVVVNTIAVTGTLLSGILSSPAAANFLAAINTLLKVNESIEREKKVKELPDHPYGALKQVLEDFSGGLKATGLSQAQRDLMTYKFLQTLLEDPKASHEIVQFLQASAQKNKKKGKR